MECLDSVALCQNRRGRRKSCQTVDFCYAHVWNPLLILVMLAPEEILILGGAKYKMAVWLIAPMVSGTLFRFYSYSYSALQNYYKRTQYVAAGTIGTMVLNVILNYVCILNFGYMAAASTTAFSYIILLLVQES